MFLSLIHLYILQCNFIRFVYDSLQKESYNQVGIWIFRSFIGEVFNFNYEYFRV